MNKTLILVFLFLSLSCESSDINYQKLNKQDSLQIINMINCYLESGHILFQNFAEKKDKILGLDIEFIFYSPDSTKMFAITYLEFKSKSKSKYCTSQDSSTFFFYPFVGYRSRNDLKWIMYFYNSQILLSDCKKKFINKYIKEEFIINFHKTKVSSFQNNEIIEKEVGFNINEDGFWKSPFWEKGGLVKDKYFFEVKITDYFDNTFEIVDEVDCSNKSN